MHPSELPQPHVEHGVWGIISPYGNIWSPLVFDTPEKEREHLTIYWHNIPKAGISEFRIVKVRRTVEVERIESVEMTFAPEHPND